MTAADLDDFDRWRREFPILATTVYMISNSLGAMPAAAADSLADYARTWATRGVRAWEERWWEMSREIGDRIGAIISAPAGSVSMHANVTTATAVALSCLQPMPRRNRIVCLETDFPSIIYLLREMQSVGWELIIVPAEPDFSVRVDRIVDAIDHRTALVHLSHVLFKTSYIMDPAPIVAAAHHHGALVLLDGYQSAGIIPVDVAALGVDFFTGGCLKWLCGGPGAAFMATRPDRLPAMRPRFTGWLAHRAPFAFATEPLVPRDDAMRMMGGTPPIAAYYASLPGLDIISRVGVDRIRAKSQQMTARVLALADQHGFPSIAPRDPARLAGTVAVDPPDALPVSRALKARDFLVDYRPGVGIRISPHFYNTMDEIDRTMATLAEIVERKAYDRDAPPRSVVT
jgi:kynureninase